VHFGVHDALPFLSSNAATLADAALAVRRLQRTARAAVVVAALSAVALEANPEAFSDPVLHRLPGAGGRLVCHGVRAVLGAVPRSSPRVQDPLGLRCLPAVQGCVLDALSALEDAVDGLLGTAAENPLIVPAAGADGPVHHGLFHLAGLALAADAAAIAVAQSVPLLLSRLNLLADPACTGLPAFLADGVPGSSGTMLLEYVAAAALGQLRNLAAPASLGSVSLSRGVEEDHSFASQAAVQLLRAAPAYTTAVAAELVAAVRALRMSASTLAAGPWQDVLDLCQDLPAGVHDRDLTEDVLIAERLLPRLAGPDDRGDPIPAGHA
jgi:histidine ammonia-lyase